MREVHDWAGRGRPRHRLRHRVPPPALRGDGAHRRRRGATSTSGRAGPSPGGRLPSVRVVQAPAASTTLPDATVDVAHARWAYFFGPGCEPGLAELDRVMRPGGTAFVVDNDATRSTFGAWFRRSLPSYDPEAVERFWLRQGWSRRPLDIAWTFDSPRGLRPGAAHRVPSARSPTRSSPPTRTAPAWTTPSTSGGGTSEHRADRQERVRSRRRKRRIRRFVPVELHPWLGRRVGASVVGGMMSR